METITIKEILKLMENGSPFSISYVKADVKRSTGGKIEHYDECMLTHYDAKDRTKVTASFMKGYVQKSIVNHSSHFTRNILLSDMTIRRVHIDLIIRFNNIKVI